MPTGELVPEEVFFHSKVKHPSIIELLGHFWHDNSFVMVMETPQKPCDLADYFIAKGKLDENEARQILRQVGGTVWKKEEGEKGVSPQCRV